MSKKVIIVFILIILVCGFVVYQFILTPKNTYGGLKVITNLQSNVFLNDQLLGKTPYEDKKQAGEYVLKLIPDSSASEANAWQGKVMINPLVLTYINRELGSSELLSAGEILTLEKINQSKSQITVTSQPDASVVLLDGQEKGATPTTFDVSIGEHDVSINSPGFISRTVRIQATSGYKLNINFQLALANPTSELPSVSSTPSSSITTTPPVDKSQILIKDTPTGFLRVRADASTAAQEVAQVKPGERYTLIDEKESWFKIIYTEGKEGWVSSRYAEKAQ